MINSSNKIKKEVSCNVFISTFEVVKRKNINLKLVLKNIPYSLDYLLNKHERIEWNVLCKLIDNLRPFITISDFEEMGALDIKKGFNLESVLSGFIFFSLNKISKIISEKIIKSGEHNISCIKGKIVSTDNNRIKVKYYVDEKHEFIPEFVYVMRGAFLELGKLFGYREFKVKTIWISKGAIFDISWKKEGIFFGIKKWFIWIFNIHKTFLDLTESHEQLLNQYNKLEVSKALLQKQTTQLKTAHEITKSIRQSLEIRKTLNAITNALVNEAKFSSARIILFNDIEGNTFETEAYSGTNESNVNPVSKSIIIDNVKIGELIIYPKIGVEFSECEELLNYLIPIINVSIYDSLVLRTITDYKDNLETKVKKRTEELTKTQVKLSETIHLLQSAQQVQNRFFTNISHEFRTPLTLILGPAKLILEHTNQDRIKEDADIIYRSAKKLNRLANQLLDISSIEAGKMKLKTSRQNLILVIKEIVSSFQSFAERKKISLRFRPCSEEIILYLDKDKIDKILSNILSNAIKFTPQGGCVNVETIFVEIESGSRRLQPAKTGQYRNLKVATTEGEEGGCVEITVSDTGIGIPRNQMDKIFDRFYQVDSSLSKEYEGTGIGLSLTKELVELHKGKISIESEEGKGSTFKVILPLGKEHLLPEEIVEEVIEVEDKYEVSSEPGLQFPVSNQLSQSEDNLILTENSKIDKSNIKSIEKTDKPLLLIVEDNLDVRKYIINILNSCYKIVEASDGEEGVNKSFEQIPDLIISDIMMPKMDGIKLCNVLKTDSRTSHIPLILLTAKATLKDKIEGLETGADDYIMKPFEAEELQARIKNLLEQRRRIHEHFQKFGIFGIDEKHITSVDQKFLQKVSETINLRIPDPSFSVEVLAENLAMSRSLLHKKLASLVGEPPGELIKRFRLNKAAKLIECKSGNITEIAFDVGFNDPSHFTACFRKQFGMSPSQYHQKHTNN